MTRLGILASHPVQYYAPLFRELAKQADLHVFYAHSATPEQQAAAGFGKGFNWDVDLTSGYSHSFLHNVARDPGTGHFAGCDTPEIAQYLGQGGFGAVLALGWHLKSMLQGIWAAKRLGLSVMVRGDSHLETPRGAFKTAVKALTYPALLRAFDACLYVGQRNRAYYKHYGVPEARLFYSPHCVDTDRFASGASPEARAEVRQRLGIGAGKPVVLFAGKLLPLKRPGDVILAAARVRASGMPLEILVAGAGPLEADLRSLADSNKVPLHMLGFCNQSEMPAVYAASDVLVVPSNGETWGLVANEAIASGKPVILSNAVGSAPDLTGDGRAGRTFILGDIIGLADSLCETLVQPPCPEIIAKINEFHTLDAAVEGIINAMRAVVRN